MKNGAKLLPPSLFKNTRHSIDEEDLRAYCEKKLGRYKIPKKFIQVDELPKTHVGKIDKKKLKEFSNQT